MNRIWAVGVFGTVLCLTTLAKAQLSTDISCDAPEKISQFQVRGHWRLSSILKGIQKTGSDDLCAQVYLSEYIKGVGSYWEGRNKRLNCSAQPGREVCSNVAINLKYLRFLKSLQKKQETTEGSAICVDCDSSNPHSRQLVKQIREAQVPVQELVMKAPDRELGQSKKELELPAQGSEPPTKELGPPTQKLAQASQARAEISSAEVSSSKDCREIQGVQRCLQVSKSNRPVATIFDPTKSGPAVCAVFFHGARADKGDFDNRTFLDRFKFEQQIRTAKQPLMVIAPMGSLKGHDLEGEFNSVSALAHLVRQSELTSGRKCDEVILSGHSLGHRALSQTARALSHCTGEQNLCSKIKKIFLYDGFYHNNAASFKRWLSVDSTRKLIHLSGNETFGIGQAYERELGATGAKFINRAPKTPGHYGPVSNEFVEAIEAAD